MTPPASRPGIRHALLGAAAVALLLLVFAAYLRPDFLVMLSNQVWTCF